MINLKIKVTKQVLEESKYCMYDNHEELAGRNCAISLAIRDIFPDAFVAKFHIYPTKKNWYIDSYGNFSTKHKNTDNVIKLPEVAIHFINDFDGKIPEQRVLMPEIEFEISIPDELIEEINIEELKPLLQNHPTLELIEN